MQIVIFAEQSIARIHPGPIEFASQHSRHHIA
jgi:hypothetical protein